MLALYQYQSCRDFKHHSNTILQTLLNSLITPLDIWSFEVIFEFLGIENLYLDTRIITVSLVIRKLQPISDIPFLLVQQKHLFTESITTASAIAFTQSITTAPAISSENAPLGYRPLHLSACIGHEAGPCHSEL